MGVFGRHSRRLPLPDEALGLQLDKTPHGRSRADGMRGKKGGGCRWGRPKLVELWHRGGKAVRRARGPGLAPSLPCCHITREGSQGPSGFWGQSPGDRTEWPGARQPGAYDWKAGRFGMGATRLSAGVGAAGREKRGAGEGEEQSQGWRPGNCAHGRSWPFGPWQEPVCTRWGTARWQQEEMEWASSLLKTFLVKSLGEVSGIAFRAGAFFFFFFLMGEK